MASFFFSPCARATPHLAKLNEPTKEMVAEKEPEQKVYMITDNPGLMLTFLAPKCKCRVHGQCKLVNKGSKEDEDYESEGSFESLDSLRRRFNNGLVSRNKEEDDYSSTEEIDDEDNED